MEAQDKIKEIETRMEQMTVRKEQMKELCRRKDKDIFDIVYNVSSELKDINPNLEERLKDRAVEGKKTDLDPTKTPLQKEENYSNLLLEIERLYSSAFALMLENIKSILHESLNHSEVEKQNNLKTSLENAKATGTPIPEQQEQQEPEAQKEKKRGLFGGKKEAKDKKVATVERVSLADLNNEKSQMENGNNNNNDLDDEKYRAYNESVKNRASSNEQSYEASGMQQERVMERPAPSYTPKSDKK